MARGDNVDQSVDRPVKRPVENHFMLRDVLKAWGGEEGSKLADSLLLMSQMQGIQVIERLLEVYCSVPDDENALYMLEALERVTYREGELSLNARIGPMMWRLQPLLQKCRLWVYGRLLREWTCDIGDARSLNAFRRLIAQVWPLPNRESHREGESEMEIAARGRDASRSEQKGALALVAAHLDSGFLLTMEQIAGDADALFSPWLAQPWVPSDVRLLLMVARTRHGGAKLAERDMRNARILDGLPDSALSVIAGITAVMLRTAGEAEEVLADIMRRTKERHSVFDAQTNLQRTYKFTEPHNIEIRVGAEGEHDLSELHADAILAIDKARTEGKLLNCDTTLVVYTDQCGDKPGTELGNRWHKHTE